MTKLEVIKANKEAHAKLINALGDMHGLERLVAEYITLAWIKGHKWMGGMSDREFTKRAQVIIDMNLGYDFDAIMAEADRQMGITI